MTPVSKACESLITILKRNLTKYEKEYTTFNNTIREHKEISLNIKGYDVSSESEIQELYGLAIITSSEYDKYILKLNEAQQKDTDEFQKEYGFLLPNIHFPCNYDSKTPKGRYRND